MSPRKPRLVCASTDYSGLLDTVANTLAPGSSGGYVDNFRTEYLAYSLLRKFKSDESNESLVAVAKGRLLESERSCREINTKLCVPGNPFTGQSYTDLYMFRIISYARRIVEDTIGQFDLNLLSAARFTSGASYLVSRRKARPGMKLLRGSCTRACYPYARALLKMSGWSKYRPTVVPGNRVAFVPKNDKTDRAIAIEPEWNSYFQKWVGGFFKARLLERGVNLFDQKKNQRLARNYELATIDLEMASDTVSKGIVETLLPATWVGFLDDLRSPEGVLPDKSILIWEKFSSMGNCFTFELETLIFYALTRACAEVELGKFDITQYAFYGDDIVCPKGLCKSLTMVLRNTGFSVNTEKSFFDGPFRESCGVHYMDGADVTPFYVRTPINDVSRAIWLGNSIRKWAGGDPRWFDLWKLIAKSVPSGLRGRTLDPGVLFNLKKPTWRVLRRMKTTDVRGYHFVHGWLLNRLSERDFNITSETTIEYGAEAPSSDGCYIKLSYLVVEPFEELDPVRALSYYELFPQEIIRE